MVAKNPDCAKRMTVWCILAVMLVAVFAIGGYALYLSPGQGPTIQHERRAPALSDRESAAAGAARTAFAIVVTSSALSSVPQFPVRTARNCLSTLPTGNRDAPNPFLITGGKDPPAALRGRRLGFEIKVRYLRQIKLLLSNQNLIVCVRPM